MSIEMTIILTAIAFAAGFISSIAGAGGLLTLPALLWAGLPPLQALATNKVQSALGTASSAWNFFRKGHLQLRDIAPAIGFALVGSVAGTLVVQQLGNEVLRRLLPVFLIIIAGYFLLSPRVSDESSRPRLSRWQFGGCAALGMGFYGGFFGPGMGSIFPFLFVWLLGHNLRSATAHTKAMVLTINGASALLFIYHGSVLWDVALIMSIAQIIGAYLGSSLVIHRGAALVQPLIVAVTLILSIKLLFP